MAIVGGSGSGVGPGWSGFGDRFSAGGWEVQAIVSSPRSVAVPIQRRIFIAPLNDVEPCSTFFVFDLEVVLPALCGRWLEVIFGSGTFPVFYRKILRRFR